MSTFTPSFPPVILEKCLELARYIAEKKTGKAALEVKLGDSSFNFSINDSLKTQTGFPNAGFRAKKKSPSDYRRDAIRREKFLEKMRKSSAPSTTSSLDPSSFPPMDTSEVPVILTKGTPAPMTTESNEVTDTLEANILLENKTKNNIPVITARNRTEIKKTTFPPAISPINSPIKITNKHKEEEVHLIICAMDQKEASKLLSKKTNFQTPNFVGLQSVKNQHHFVFSVHIETNDIPALKDQINRLNKCANVIQFQVLSNKENHFPKQPNHCRDCRDKHSQARA